MEKYTSAETLRELLTKINAAGQTPSSGKLMLATYLTREFGFQDDPQGRIKALSGLLDLVAKVRSEVDSLELDEKYKTQILNDSDFFRERIWSHGTNVTLQNFSNNIPQAKVETLRYVEMVLAGSYSYDDLDAEAAELVSSLDELMSDILNGELPQSLKASLVKKIGDIKEMLVNYRIWGSERVEDKLFSVTGEVIVSSSADESVKKDSGLKKLTNTIGELYNFMSKARNTTEEGSKLMSAGRQFIENLPEL